MLFVPLKTVPRYERHLLFCTRLTPRHRRHRRRRGVPHLAAINRSLKAHGDSVPSTWPALFDAPIDSIPS
jgi:hypothetical protein